MRPHTPHYMQLLILNKTAYNELIRIFHFMFVYRFIEEEEIHEPKLLLVVGCIGLLVNVIGLLLLYGESAA